MAFVNITFILHTYIRLVDKYECIDVVCLDFEKEFDSVPHKRLLIKLESYGIWHNR